MVFAVDVRDLVDVAVLFGAAEDLQRFLFRDVVRAAGLDGVIRHVADLDAPVVAVVRAALADHGAGGAAGADAGGQMSVVFLEPVGDLLGLDGFSRRRDFLFDRDDVHADAVAAGAHHGGDVLKRQESHALEHFRDGRILLDAVDGRVEELRASGHEVTCAVTLLLRRARDRAVVVVMIAVVVFHEAVDGHEVQKFLNSFRRKALLVLLAEFLVGVPFALLHRERKVHLVLRQDLPQAPVLLIGRLQAEEFVRHIVGDAGAEFRVVFLLLGFAVVDRFGLWDLIIGFRHDSSPFLLRFPRGTLYCFSRQAASFSRSHFSRASMPSPVLAETGKTEIDGFSRFARPIHFSVSKSK